VLTGMNNTFVGYVQLPAADATSLNAGQNTNNTIILADGYAQGVGYSSGRQRLYIHSNGNTGLDIGNNNIPQNRLVVNSTGSVEGTLGLRFNNYSNTSITNPTEKVLSINAQGDVILVDDKQGVSGGLTSACVQTNFLPKNIDTSGNLTCSQIFDNGTSVGIGSTGPFTFTGTNAGQIGASFTGTLTLDVAGGARATGFYASSDKKFKKDIKPIDNSLDKIMALQGKTYNWRKEEFKDKNFSNELQYGLLAQEVQKVIPSLVIQSENGDLAMNYIGLIPVLIEAMKEQQTQINELKSQLSENFKTQNQDLLQFTTTKIISVSPNPSDDVITISINIEKDVATASLQVHDINGVLLNNLNLKERTSNITKTLQKDNYGKGIYIVSLIVNGKSIDTKKIIFN
jgi:trimeric autotransporter adhesin